MPDAAGYRKKFGVIIPSTNTIVEADCSRLALPGVTFHAGRMYLAQTSMASDAALEAMLAQARVAIEVAIRDVMTAKPDALVMGMSSETFRDGAAGNARFIERVRELSGLEVSTGASACTAALAAHGCRRIAVLSPYQPMVDRLVTDYFKDTGVEVVRLKGLRCPSATAIAEIGEDTIRGYFRELDGPDVDAIVQVGTNLNAMRVADEAERWLGKPVLAINAVLLWHALRANGIADRILGAGTLLREH